MPQAQRQFHIWTEAGSLLLIVPFYLYLANQKYTPPPIRNILYVLAATTAAVDGWLLYKWLQAE